MTELPSTLAVQVGGIIIRSLLVEVSTELMASVSAAESAEWEVALRTEERLEHHVCVHV